MSKIKKFWTDLYSRKNKNGEDENLERLRELNLRKYRPKVKDDWGDYDKFEELEKREKDFYELGEKKTSIYTIIFYISFVVNVINGLIKFDYFIF